MQLAIYICNNEKALYIHCYSRRLNLAVRDSVALLKQGNYINNIDGILLISED
jgi:hypothetical protein